VPGGVELSNLDKVYWPDEGLTKRDLLGYLDTVAPMMLPAIRSRPLTVIRYPDGIEGASFYQKNTPQYAPSWVKTVTLPGGGRREHVRYTLCNDPRTLQWLGNQGTIEFHPWISRQDRLERPEYLVLDIDPPEERFDAAVEVALLVRDVIGRFGLEGVAKTSGAKGVHVYVPVVRRYGYDQVRRAAERLAADAAEREPDVLTVEFRKAKRAGRVFLDATRVGKGAHIAAPFSPRARPGAPVSFPVAWDRLRRIEPHDFTIRSVPELVRREDPWRALLPRAQSLPGDLIR